MALICSLGLTLESLRDLLKIPNVQIAPLTREIRVSAALPSLLLTEHKPFGAYGGGRDEDVAEKALLYWAPAMCQALCLALDVFSFYCHCDPVIQELLFFGSSITFGKDE